MTDDIMEILSRFSYRVAYGKQVADLVILEP